MEIEILEKIRDYLDIDREEMSSKLNISIETLNTWEYRKKKIPTGKIDLVRYVFYTYFNKEDIERDYKPDGKVLENLHEKVTYVIPVKGRAGLYNSFYSDQFMDENLETEILHSKEEVSKYSKYFKIEVEGVSMDNGTRQGLCEGDWIYARSLERELWKSKLHTHDWVVWVFFHNERGILIKSIKEQNIETGELILESLNPDRKKFPDINIKLSECTFICNVIRVEYTYGK